MTLLRSQIEDSSHIIRLLSKVLTQLIDVNQKSNTRQHFVTKFQSSYAPAISIQGYLERINKYAKCSPNCFIVALIYIDRLIEMRNIVLTSLNVHRILITSVLLSTKVFDDEFYKNAYYAKLGGVSTSEMNNLEIEFLSLVNFNLYVSIETFEKYQQELQNFMNTSLSPTPSILSSSPFSPDANNQQSERGFLCVGRIDNSCNQVITSNTNERNADPTAISPLKPSDVNITIPRSYIFNPSVHFPSNTSPSINNTCSTSTNMTSSIFHSEDPIIQYPSSHSISWIPSCSVSNATTTVAGSSNSILSSNITRDSPRSLVSYPSSDPSPTLTSSSSSSSYSFPSQPSLFSSQSCHENESYHHHHHHQYHNHNQIHQSQNVHIPIMNTYNYSEGKHIMPSYQSFPILVETVGVVCNNNTIGSVPNFSTHPQLPSQPLASHHVVSSTSSTNSSGFQQIGNNNINNNKIQQQQQSQQSHSSRQRYSTIQQTSLNSNISQFNTNNNNINNNHQQQQQQQQQYNIRSIPPYQTRPNQNFSSSIDNNGANYLQNYDMTGSNYNNISQQPLFSHPANYNQNNYGHSTSQNTPVSFCPQPSTNQIPPNNIHNNNNNNGNCNTNNINSKYHGGNNNNNNNNNNVNNVNNVNGCSHQVQYTGVPYPQISTGGYFYQPIPATNIVSGSRFFPYSSTPNSVADLFGPVNDNTSPHLNQPYPILHSEEMMIPRSIQHQQHHHHQQQHVLGNPNFLGFGSNTTHPHNMGVQHSYIPWIEQHDSHIYPNNIQGSHFQCVPDIHSSNLNTYPATTLFYPVIALQSAS